MCNILPMCIIQTPSDLCSDASDFLLRLKAPAADARPSAAVDPIGNNDPSSFDSHRIMNCYDNGMAQRSPAGFGKGPHNLFSEKRRDGFGTLIVTGRWKSRS